MQLKVMGDRRWQMVMVLGVTFFVGYLDRLNISFALPLMALEYGWSDEQTREYGSLLMGLFYAGYGLANIFLTPFAQRFGPRKSMLVMICLWSLFTALGAWVSQWVMLLMMTRVLLGLSEGVHVPMMSQLVKTWFPREERARANSIFVSGLFLAVILSPLLLVPLMASLGWRSGFLLLALVGALISLPLVYLFVHNRPEDGPTLRDDELAHIKAGQLNDASEHSGEVRLAELLRMPRFLLLGAIGITNNVVALGLSSWLPTYFTNSRDIPFEDISWLVAIPYTFSLLGIGLWSFLGDRFDIRALLGGLGFAGAGVMIYAGLHAENLMLVLAFFSAGVFLISAFNACEFAMIQRIVPLDKVAPAMGVYNGCTTIIGGGLGPFIVSPIIGGDGPVWIISAIALANALMLFAAWRVIRY